MTALVRLPADSFAGIEARWGAILDREDARWRREHDNLAADHAAFRAQIADATATMDAADAAKGVL